MKYLSIIKYVLLALSAVSILLLPVMGGMEGGVDKSVGLMLIWAYVLLGLTIVITLLMPLVNLIKNPGNALRSMLGLGILVVAIGVCYALSSDTPVVNSAGGFFEDKLALRLSDTGLYAAYFALAATIVVVIFGEIRNSFK